jgi:hypothetical protein
MSLDSFNDFELTGYDPNVWDIQSDWPHYGAENEIITINKDDEENQARKIQEEQEEKKEQKPSIIIKLSVQKIERLTPAEVTDRKLPSKKASVKKKPNKNRKDSTIAELEAELQFVENERIQLQKIDEVALRRLKCNANYAEAKRIRESIASKKAAIQNINLEAENVKFRKANSELQKDNVLLYNENARLKSELESLKGIKQLNDIEIEVPISYLVSYARAPSPSKSEQVKSTEKSKNGLKI